MSGSRVPVQLSNSIREKSDKVRASRASRWVLGAAIGIACLFISESGPMTQASSWITRANARMGRPLTPLSHAGIAGRPTRRATVRGVVSGTIDLGFFGSDSIAASYGYIPGTYGGLGCFRNTHEELVCP